MNLDRSSIERIDFPLATPGYERASVDAHLRGIAAEVEALRRSGFRPHESVGASTGDQVRSVLEAAEEAAGAIRQRAEREAEAILSEARTRAHANGEAARQIDITRMTEALAHVSQAMGEMLQGVGELTSELQALAAAGAASARGAPPPRVPVPEPARDSGQHEAAPAAPPVPPMPSADRPAPPPQPLPEPAPPPDLIHAAGAPPAPAASPGASWPGMGGQRLNTQVEDARLIALNMALNRTPRAEIELYLSTHFDLPDRDGVLDEVYRRIGS